MSGELAGRCSAAAAGLAFVVAAGLAAAVAADGTIAGAGLFLDRIGAVLLLLVLGVSGVVQAFARRYLRGDVRAARFFAYTSLLTAATALMVTAGTIVALAAAWTAAGAALCALLGLYRGLPSADEGVRRTRRAFLIGDAALWAGVVVTVAAWGNLDLRELAASGAPAGDPAALSAVAFLLVIAALSRSAQLPLQGWLPATLAAPTPVSALLHAGVVNAGGILLVRTSPLFGASEPATYLAFAAGAATAVYGTALMLAKTDVKGALAHSTMAQMGFMIMTCGLGAYAAAIFHLVAHGMYKATLFLGSGGAVASGTRARSAPPRPLLGGSERARAAALALTLPAAALVVAAWALPAEGKGTGALLVFAWLTGVWGVWGWLRRRPAPLAELAAVPVVLGAAFAYLLLLQTGTGFLAGAVGPAEHAVTAWMIAPVVLALGAVSLVRMAGPRWPRVHEALYVWALGAGQPARSAPPGRRRRLPRVARLRPALLEGSRP